MQGTKKSDRRGHLPATIQSGDADHGYLIYPKWPIASTDMAWVGRLGSEAVAAIGAVGILTWMTNSISYLNKVGSEVSVGQSIGRKTWKMPEDSLPIT